MQELREERKILAEMERNTYSPESFPGSAAWKINNKAADALKAFDLAHPEIIAEIKIERAAARKAKYDGLSDFVKMGS